jgi:hypothetical protein
MNETANVPTTDVVPLAIPRHLAIGASAVTLCGLDRSGLVTAHPSKARKTDCLACRDALRKDKAAPGALKSSEPEGLKAGQYVEHLDGSAWEVLSVNQSGAHMKCVIASAAHAKGRTTTVSPNSALRVFSTEEFVALVRRLDAERAAAETANPAAPPKPRPTGRWSPSEEEVAKVKELRATGLSYIAIETEMKWPQGHGNRPWRIMMGTLIARPKK